MIELLDVSSSRDEFAAFLSARPDRSVYHTAEWQEVIEATYGHRCRYWVARSGGSIRGVFPVVNVRHPLMGSKMVALPYQFHGGLPLADEEEVRARLIESALADAREAGVAYLEIRHSEPASFLEDLGFVPVDSQLVTTVTPLVGLRKRQMRKGHREEVNYALRRGVRLEETREVDDLREFRRLYLRECRALGAPQAGWALFANIHRRMGERWRLLLARSEDDRCLGGLLTLDDGGVIFARCGAYSSPEALKLRVGKALFWRAMEDASQRGCTSFSFGISWVEDNGLIHFKEGWNGTSAPVGVHVYPIRSKAPAAGGYLGGFKLAKTVWSRLPMPLVDWMGQRVTRWIC